MKKASAEKQARLAAAKRAKIALMDRALTRYVQETDIIAPIQEWPGWTKSLLFKPHKNRNERYNLMIWLWRNGVSAEIAEPIVMFHHKFGNDADGTSYKYDADAHRQMKTLVTDLNNPMSKQYEIAKEKAIFMLDSKQVEPAKTREQY